MSGFPMNKVSPKDAASNLSYLLSRAVYGVVTAEVLDWEIHPYLLIIKREHYWAWLLNGLANKGF